VRFVAIPGCLSCCGTRCREPPGGRQAAIGCLTLAPLGLWTKHLRACCIRCWSPTTFDRLKDVTGAEVESLLEAARWAPSAGNSQPWAFILGCRSEPTHDRLVRHLAKSSAAWAPTAGLLVANLSHRFVEDTDWDYSDFSVYDLGQAVAHMSFQAQSLGLHVRQLRAFDRAGLATEFEVPQHWEVTTMSAIGHVPRNSPQDDQANSSRPARHRRSSTEIRWPQASFTERR